MLMATDLVAPAQASDSVRARRAVKSRADRSGGSQGGLTAYLAKEALRGILAVASNLAQSIRRHMAAYHMEFRFVRLEAKSVR